MKSRRNANRFGSGVILDLSIMFAQYATDDKRPMSPNFNVQMTDCQGQPVADHPLLGRSATNPTPIGLGKRLVWCQFYHAIRFEQAKANSPLPPQRCIRPPLQPLRRFKTHMTEPANRV
jgi:hypothetical protein